MTHRWLEGFVRSVGVETAEFLLKDNGLPRNYSATHNITDWVRPTPKKNDPKNHTVS